MLGPKGETRIADREARGEGTFQRCYSATPSIPKNSEGPSLYRIMGRPAAGCPRLLLFRCYEEKGGRRARLGRRHPRTYNITDYRSVVVGTSMNAPPGRDEQGRADLIAFLALSGWYRP